MLSLFAEIAKKVMPASPVAAASTSTVVAASSGASVAVGGGDQPLSPKVTSSERSADNSGALSAEALKTTCGARGLCAPPPFDDTLTSMPSKARDAHIRSVRHAHVQVCMKLVVDLMHHKANHNLFNAPVDAVALNIPDYFSVIEHPMDLGTIRRRLEQSLYSSIEAVAKDVRLVFRNATFYNPPTNRVHHDALELNKYFEDRLPKLLLGPHNSRQLTQCLACGERKCYLCNQACLRLESEPLTCEGPCKQKISPGAPYVSNEGILGQRGRTHVFCRKCYTRKLKLLKLHAAKSTLVHATAAARAAMRDGLDLEMLQTFIRRENSGYVCEAWVACTCCAKWAHMVCALHNPRYNGSVHVCHQCRRNVQTTKDTPAVGRGEQRIVDVASNHSATLQAAVTSARSESTGPKSSIISSSQTLSAATPEKAVGNSSDGEPRALANTCSGCTPSSQSSPTMSRSAATPTTPHSALNTTSHTTPTANTSLKASRLESGPSSRSSPRHRRALPMSARNLVRTPLSDELEARVKKRVALEWKSRGRADLSAANVEDMAGLTIRVLSARRKTFSVDLSDEVLRALRYPKTLTANSLAVCVFQCIDGIDVLLYAMYLEEFGRNCGPNSNLVYIGYIDSVKFLRPSWLRTPVYHEVLKGYLHSAKVRGFHCAHIWACPPLRGIDYIFHVHPVNQRTPNPEKLQQWYRDVLEEAQQEGIVSDLSTLYHDFFGPKPCRPKFILPYLKGHYWQQQINGMLAHRRVTQARLRNRALAAAAAQNKLNGVSPANVDAVNADATKTSHTAKYAVSMDSPNILSDTMKRNLAGSEWVVDDTLPDPPVTVKNEANDPCKVVRESAAVRPAFSKSEFQSNRRTPQARLQSRPNNGGAATPNHGSHRAKPRTRAAAAAAAAAAAIASTNAPETPFTRQAKRQALTRKSKLRGSAAAEPALKRNRRSKTAAAAKAFAEAAKSEATKLPPGVSSPAASLAAIGLSPRSTRDVPEPPANPAVAHTGPSVGAKKQRKGRSLMQMLSQRLEGIQERFIVARLQPLVPDTGGMYADAEANFCGLSSSQSPCYSGTPAKQPATSSSVTSRGSEARSSASEATPKQRSHQGSPQRDEPKKTAQDGMCAETTGSQVNVLSPQTLQFAPTRYYKRHGEADGDENAHSGTPVELSCGHWDDRQGFLELCSSNHLQFDSLRRAKFATLVLLQHFAAHAQLRHCNFDTCINDFVHTCFHCRTEIISSARWQCATCSGFNLCETCMKATTHEHPLIPFEAVPVFFQSTPAPVQKPRRR